VLPYPSFSHRTIIWKLLLHSRGTGQSSALLPRQLCGSFLSQAQWHFFFIGDLHSPFEKVHFAQALSLSIRNTATIQHNT